MTTSEEFMAMTSTVVCRKCDPILYLHPDHLDAHNADAHFAEPLYSGEEAVAMLNALVGLPDIEEVHARADEIVVRLLDGIGGSEAVKVYRQLPKWYA